MYILKTSHNFEASHHLKGHLGGCRNNHGHSYQVYIEIAQEEGAKLKVPAAISS